MSRFIAITLVLVAGNAWAGPRKLAVLELRGPEGEAAALTYLTDRVRAAALALPRDRFFVMTRENIMDQLPPGTDLAECQGDCELETARNIGADYLATGELVWLGDGVRASLKLYETERGALLATDKAAAEVVDALEEPLEAAAKRLFELLDPRGFKVSAPGPLPAAGQAPKAAGGLDFSTVDVDALEAYDAVVRFERSGASAEQKAERWEALGAVPGPYQAVADDRADAWRARSKAAAEMRAARDRDWSRLSRLLRLEVVSAADKARWARAFLDTYGSSARTNPHAPELWGYLRQTGSGKLAGSVWAGKDSDGDYYVYRFRSGGHLEYTSPTGTFRGATWRQNGDRLYMQTNDRYSEYEGRIVGRRIEGRAWNRGGHEWSWVAEPKAPSRRSRRRRR